MKTLTSTLISLLFTLKAFACECIGSTVKEELSMMDVIVTGTFISGSNNVYPLIEGGVEKEPLYWEGKLVVTEILKGNHIEIGDTITIGTDSTNCAFMYKNQRQYLIFGIKSSANIQASICTHTSEVDDVTNHRAYQEAKSLLAKETEK